MGGFSKRLSVFFVSLAPWSMGDYKNGKEVLDGKITKKRKRKVLKRNRK